MLGVEAAVRTGVGLIRYLGEAAELVLARRPEVVIQSGRVSAWLIGSGVPALEPTAEIVHNLAGFAGPLVLDAGALEPEVLNRLRGARMLLTPHAGEAARLLGCERHEVTDEPVAAACQLSEQFRATVLVKGAETVIAEYGAARTMPKATGWLATAGSGDVLGGILGALAAMHPERNLFELAQAGAWLHARAGELASAGAPASALSIAEAISPVLREGAH